MTDPSIAAVPRAVDQEAEPRDEVPSFWLLAAVPVLVTALALALALGVLQLLSPERALCQVFSNVLKPFSLARATDMVDTNTWLTVQWDRSLVQSIRTGRVTATVDIVTSVPDHPLDPASFAKREVYLQLLKAGQLRKVIERATLTFEMHGGPGFVLAPWRLVGSSAEQFNAQARANAYLARETHGPLTFVADEGVYTDTTSYSTMRVDAHHSGEFFGLIFALTALIVGASLAIAKGSAIPVISGVFAAAVIFYGPGYLLASAMPALRGVLDWGILG